MGMNVIIFGQLTDITGCDKLTLSGIADSNELQNEMNRRYPALKTARYIIAIDKKVIRNNISLHDNSTIALLPPFSGG
jgi:molybdopterin synthase sulfur carrier subunit